MTTKYRTKDTQFYKELEALKIELLANYLFENNNNILATSKQTGLSRLTIYKLLKKALPQ